MRHAISWKKASVAGVEDENQGYKALCSAICRCIDKQHAPAGDAQQADAVLGRVTTATPTGGVHLGFLMVWYLRRSRKCNSTREKFALTSRSRCDSAAMEKRTRA